MNGEKEEIGEKGEKGKQGETGLVWFGLSALLWVPDGKGYL